MVVFQRCSGTVREEKKKGSVPRRVLVEENGFTSGLASQERRNHMHPEHGAEGTNARGIV